MTKRPLGCLSTSGLIAFILSLVIIGAAFGFRGNDIFSPGALSASRGATAIGNVWSHAELAEDCSACHTTPWSSQHMSNRCVECHQEIVVEIKDSGTFHGAYYRSSEKINCRTCHTEHNGPEADLTTFSQEIIIFHELLGYVLTGHLDQSGNGLVGCVDCHWNKLDTFSPASCEDCHLEIDQQFGEAHIITFSRNCLDCHDGVDTYGDDFDHDNFSFPLVGEHEDIDCASCHSQRGTKAELKSTSQACVDCHRDDDVHFGEMSLACGVCHTAERWDRVEFDHSTTGFLVTGGHEDLECEDCHIEPGYSSVSTACISCHTDDDRHNGLFGAACEQCHTPENWDIVTVDHSAPGTGSCRACHNIDKPANHWTALCSACHSTTAWKPAGFDHRAAGASQCADCHTGEKPANHFAGQCSACHSTSAWKPASLKHTFPLNHEGAGQKCALCHQTTNYQTYTCYGCHEHNLAEVKKEHKKISNFNNCVECHWDGREHEGREDDDDD